MLDINDLLATKTGKDFLSGFTAWQDNELQKPTITGFFRPMDLKAAKAFLRRFIEAGREAIDDASQDAEVARLRLDYSVDSLPMVLKWMMRGVRSIRIPVPDDWPIAVKRCFENGILLIDESSKLAFLRAAFYLGESFVRSNPSLRWATGSRKHRNLMANMPVVAGFVGEELPPLVSLRYVYLDILDGGRADTIIDVEIRKLICHLPTK